MGKVRQDPMCERGSSVPGVGLRSCTPRVVRCNNIKFGRRIIHGDGEISIYAKCSVYGYVCNNTDSVLHD